MQKLLITILLSLVASPIYSQIKLTVVGEIFRPFSYEENEVKKGMVTEIVQELLKESQIKPSKWIISPWKYVFKYAKDHNNTLLYTIVKNPEREKLFHWIGPISDRNFCLYRLKDRTDIKVDTWKDLKKYSVSSLEDGAGTKEIESHGIEVYKTRDLKQSFKMVVNKRVDLMGSMDYALYHFKNSEKLEGEFVKAFTVNNTSKYYIALNINTDPEIVTSLKSSFTKIKSNGTLEKIKSKYLK
jgi:polar amino acid transport system substrate-binding protein